jgi:hypothetical protein
VLFDRIVIDDHISAALQAFATGVRVVVVADTCHAGGDIDDQLMINPRGLTPRFRIMPSDVMAKTIEAHPEFLEPGLAAGAADVVPKASILLVAACADKELAQDESPNGVFTTFLVNTTEKSPQLGYEELVAEVKKSTKAFGQNPELHPFGPPTGKFLTGPVFTVPK